MIETIKLSLDEIRSEKLDLIKQLKVFAKAIFLVPVAVMTHIAVMFLGIFAIPNSVVDIITLSEKTKQAIEKKRNDG